MALLFRNELHQDFGAWPLAYIPYGGADFGEVRTVGEAVGEGDDTAYCDAWNEAGDRLKTEADAALGKGHIVSARALYLRASAFYAASFHPLYGAPVDPRLLAAFAKQVSALDEGLALGPSPVRPAQIPFGSMSLPAYLIPAQGIEGETRPLIIFNNGYDGTITDMYFASAVAASRRGYHSLLFDGPGQGAMLYRNGVPLRPDWDVVIQVTEEEATLMRIVRSGVPTMGPGANIAPSTPKYDGRGPLRPVRGTRDLVARSCDRTQKSRLREAR